MFNLTTLNHFLLVAWPLPATHFVSIKHITALHILNFTITQSKRLLLTVLHCSLYTEVASRLGGLQPKWHLVLRSLPIPHAFLKSMHLEVIAVLHYNNRDGAIHACVFMLVFHQSKCISAMRRILSTVATYIRSNIWCICVFLVTAMHV